MKLALGTVQFGLKYGAFNTDGQVSPSEVALILQEAQASGITMLDTASAYGESEAVLGQLHAPQTFSVVTKVPPVDAATSVFEFVTAKLEESLQRLNTPQVYALMLHRAADLLGEYGSEIWRALTVLRKQGLVQKIGVSVYGPDEALKILAAFPIEIIQLPFNVFDIRSLDAGVLAQCAAGGIEVHARSAFLQGFALREVSDLDPYFTPYASNLSAFREQCGALGMTPLAGALRFVLDQPAISKVVVGVESSTQLRQIVAAASGPSAPPNIWHRCHSNEPGLVEPFRWRIGAVA